MKVLDLSFFLLPLLTAASPVVVDSIHNGAAPILSSSNAAEVPDSYLVVFKKHVSPDSALEHTSWVQDIHESSHNSKKRSLLGLDTDKAFRGLKNTFNIGDSLMGYSGHFDENVIEQVRRHPDVSAVPCVMHTYISQAF